MAKGRGKTTSPGVARIAGRLLASPHTSKAVKRVSASDLTQHEHKPKGGK